MNDFKDKVAVITGAASGIGRGIVNRAAKEGMKIVLADIEAEALSQAEKELKSSGANVISVLTDVTKDKDIEKLAQKTIDTFGEIHLLCNNAGVGIYGLLWECSLSDWKWTMDVNLWGVIHGIRTFIPIMLKQDNECHIVNTASMAGLSSQTPGAGIYSITKYGVVALSEALFIELRGINSKIKVSVFCPSTVSTRIDDSERNRPAEYCDPEFEPAMDKLFKIHPGLASNIETFMQTVKAGLSPNKAGDIVFESIKNDIFYILTDTGLAWKRIVKRRMDRIMKAFTQNKSIIKGL